MNAFAKHLAKDSKTVTAIYAKYKECGDGEPQRGYLGASIIGHHCSRYLWYCFRQCCRQDISGRVYRLFATGNLEEARFTEDLIAIGCEVHEADPQGEQFEVSALGGHFSGHMDGAILGVPEAPKTWHVGEYKTHNAKSFATLKKDGVEASKPQHYAQMQIYMHLSGMKRALYLARNKDTDALYSERIKYDAEYATTLLVRAEQIITTTTPPDRMTDRPDYYECKWCDAHAVCWGDASSALPIRSLSCRQCCHATPEINGLARWTCEKHKRDLSIEDQDNPCTFHLVLPGLIGFASPMDYESNAIMFVNWDGDTWKQGEASDCISSSELMVLPPDKLTVDVLTAAREKFGAVAIGHHTQDSIESKQKHQNT